MTNQYTSYSDHYEQPFNQYNFHVQRFYKQFCKQFAIKSEMAWILQENYYTMYLEEDGYGALSYAK